MGREFEMDSMRRVNDVFRSGRRPVCPSQQAAAPTPL